MTGYRIGSVIQAFAYLGLVVSLAVRPVRYQVGQASVYDSYLSHGWWAGMFTVVAVATLVLAARWPKQLHVTHAAMIPVLATYGSANLGTSIVNGTGWQIAALCAALIAGHVIGITTRPMWVPGPLGR